MAQIDAVLSEWRGFVAEIRSGYDGSIYEFDNDLATRRLLEEALSESPSEAASYLHEVRVLDEEFLALTRERKKPMKLLKGWWYNRVPLNPGPELHGDLLANDE